MRFAIGNTNILEFEFPVLVTLALTVNSLGLLNIHKTNKLHVQILKLVL